MHESKYMQYRNSSLVFTWVLAGLWEESGHVFRTFFQFGRRVLSRGILRKANGLSKNVPLGSS